MYFSDSRLMIFHPTKTGGTTIELYLMQAMKDSVTPHSMEQIQYLNQYGYDEHLDIKKQIMFGNYEDDLVRISLQHACIVTARRVLGEAVFDRARKVAIVRNPYFRILSLFFYYGFDSRLSFSSFVHDVLPPHAMSSSKVALNPTAKQTLYTHHNGALAVDLLLRQEHMAEGVADLSRFLGVEIAYDELMRRRASKASLAFKDYMDAYDEPSREVVRELYVEDFALLGYEP